MAINNTVELIGNMNTKGVRIIESEDKKTFAAFSLATNDSYKDKDGNWQDKKEIWHDIVAFSPALIQILKGFNEKARIKVTASLSYRTFEVQDADGQIIKKKEASIIARKIEQAPITKKNQEA
ncbi:MAG: single-stranded DNA-binding protein [Bacteroidota bacterium]